MAVDAGRIINRLFGTGDADQPWALIILAAMEGPAAIQSLLDGVSTVSVPAASDDVAPGAAIEPPGAYVTSIAVEGFRGIGPAATLKLRPGPGLTLVVGRNGSGKSSFAESLEYVLTGCNYRWEGRPKAWGAGWRNLHHDQVSLKADLLVEGKGPLSVARTWPGQDLDDHAVDCAGPGKGPHSLESIGWDTALETFRPFLSYNELGTLLENGPSTLYDALSNVLGLEELVAVQTLLASTRKSRQALCDEAVREGGEIRTSIDRLLADGAADDRLERARAALDAKTWDVSALNNLVQDVATPEASQLGMLRRLEGIPVIDADAVSRSVERLRSTARVVADLAGSNAERSLKRADLLQQAVTFHERHKDPTCPVCGTADVLNAPWAVATRGEIAQLRNEAAACQSATSEAKSAVRDAHRHVTPPPALLAQVKDAGVPGLAEARRLWIDWSNGREIEESLALAEHMEARVLKLVEAIRTVVEQAAEERARREDVWRPISAAIQAWLPRAKKAISAKDQVKGIKSAEAWWKTASADVRDERFAPIADRAKAIWNQLRLQSNVDLGDVTLGGQGGQRRVTLKVTVDGTPAEALGVMSQGELHSLALSLFLPRATLAESPFRFICIDDPVQSMDPSRVEGLARVLDEAAKTRQVIVFTHDDRLPEAVRRLGFAAVIHSVTRRARSVVEVREVTDPISTLLDDARAVALTEDLPADVASRVVPGFCRAAVEAACMESVRRRRLTKGDRHEAVEELLASNAKIYPLIALALFDDERRTNDVMPKLKKLGAWAVDVFAMCKAGAHERHDGELMLLIKSSERLARELAAKA